MIFSSPNGKTATNSYNLRIFLLLCFITAVTGLIVVRLFNLQIINHQYFQVLASDQHEFIKTILPKRGEIYLTPLNGDPVVAATNITKNLVYAQPKEINNPTNVAVKLARVIGISEQEILTKVSSKNQSYVVLKKQLPDAISEQIKELKLAGIYLEPEVIRYYPEKQLASHVLGFVGFKDTTKVGQYGIEGKFERQLAGIKGILDSQKDLAGRWITLAARTFIPSTDGDNIYLTIDPAIQFKVEEVLRAAVSKHGADSGSALILNPKTGAVLAMANIPDFDPNEYNRVEDIATFINSVVSANYEPGSVFKPITMAGALNEGRVTPQMTYTDWGEIDFGDHKIKNSDGEAHGLATMTQVLEKSLNTGAVFALQQLGNENFRKYVKKFGFGTSLDFELGGGVAGNIDNLNQKGDIFFATASFGQGITVTPLQLATAFTAIANSGKMMKPYIVSKIVHPDDTQEGSYPQILDQVIDPKTAATLSAMMVSVVENGHGKKAAVKGYYIAGKTGTAQVAYKDRAGYDPNNNIGSFVGFGPVEDPLFLALVRINHPRDVKFAESTAAPAFGEIAQFILNYLQIPPSRQ